MKLYLNKKTQRRVHEHDYLKYYGVVAKWVKSNYGLTQREFELLCFLFSERLFTKSNFQEYSEVFSWDRDRFFKMKREGWVTIWQERTRTTTTVYELSPKAKSLMKSVYRKLNGKEPISESGCANVMYQKTKARSTDRRLGPLIRKNNKEVEARNRPQ